MRDIGWQLSRDDGYLVNPLRLELTSYVRAGKLDVETQDDEEETNFHLPLSDIIKNEQVIHDVIKFFSRNYAIFVCCKYKWI